MSDKKIVHLLLDTSYLCGVSFDDPDFRKLLQRSKDDELRIFVPHIVWEERRTQFFEIAYDKVRRVQNAWDGLNTGLANNFLLGDLIPPALTLWTKAEIEAQSRDVMSAFAKQHNIEILPLASDHAERAWRRYFDVGLPFNPDVKRETRRKDIPDSWIFEASIDLKSKYPNLLALCRDGPLSGALRSIDIRVFEKTQEVLEEIDAGRVRKPALEAFKTKDAAMPGATQPDLRLTVALTEAQAQFKNLDTKLLGYVAYLGSPSKDQLFSLLERSGVSLESAKNVAERLAIAKVITDTGNHYLAGNKESGELAAALVEAEIIRLLENEG
jgi:predicted nucleic acid-binding protein